MHMGKILGMISSWMRNLGHVEDKFRIILIRRVPDMMDVRVFQGRKPKDIRFRENLTSDFGLAVTITNAR